MPYVSKKTVRKEAGFHNIERKQLLAGVANGVNTVFATEGTPIVDNTDDDLVTIADIIVYVNDVVVTVSAINATTGAVTLASPPANEAVVLATYAHSQIEDADVEAVIEEADEMIDGVIGDYIDLPLAVDSKFIKRARLISKYFASGFLLVRDYGSFADTEETSKDGFKKIEQATEWLNSLKSDLANESATLRTRTASVRSDGKIFKREFEAGIDPVDKFMRKIV